MMGMRKDEGLRRSFKTTDSERFEEFIETCS